MAFTNLPGIFEDKQDGNLIVTSTNNNPIVMVLGTASQGDSETNYLVRKVSDAATAFAKTGTLTRGMYEAKIGGALNLRLFRIGATAAVLTTIGAGVTITTASKDSSTGTDFTLFWDDSAQGSSGKGRLRVYRASDSLLVYDNNPVTPTDKVDLNLVVVEGDFTAASSGNIGTLAVPVTLLAADGVNGAAFTAGTDGTALSRMKLYESLNEAYSLLQDQEIDVVLPMNVYLDDLNVMDMTAATVSALGLDSISAYPTAGSDTDALGKVYIEEVSGINKYWWWLPSAPNADVDATFTSDGGANIFPTDIVSGVALGSPTQDLTGSDFHEVNFAYQLANFCYTQSRDNTEMTGVIGVLPPTSFSPKDVAEWVGQLPTTEEDANANTVISVGANGTGLLGNKFMSGRLASAETAGMPGLTINGVAGLFNGGFIATDTGFLDGTQLLDDNDHIRDIGKYISVVATHPVLSNPSRTTSYSATGAATYGGFYSVLPANSAPTNKRIRNMRLPFRVNTTKLDLLAGQHYVTFHAKPQGVVISDAPTAARPDSDYQRLSTVRQVKAAMDAVRQAGEPFIGEGLTGAQLAALDTAIDGALKALVKQGIISRYQHTVKSTPQQRVLGQATVDLKLVPAFELRQITVVIALAAV